MQFVRAPNAITCGIGGVVDGQPIVTIVALETHYGRPMGLKKKLVFDWSHRWQGAGKPLSTSIMAFILVSLLRIIIVAISFIVIMSFDVRPGIERYCRDRDRLITSEKLDEYLLVDAEINSTLLLECHFWFDKSRF